MVIILIAIYYYWIVRTISLFVIKFYWKCSLIIVIVTSKNKINTIFIKKKGYFSKPKKRF